MPVEQSGPVTPGNLTKWVATGVIADAGSPDQGDVGPSVEQSGSVTPGHIPVFVADGTIQDGGAATDGYATNIGMFDNGGLPFAITATDVPRADFDFNTDAYTQMALQVSSDGVGRLLLNSYNPQIAVTFYLNLNGVDYLLPGTGFGSVTSVGATGGITTDQTNGDPITFSGNVLLAPISDLSFLANLSGGDAGPVEWPLGTTSIASGLTAAGSTQGTATPLNAAINIVTTVAASTGVVVNTAFPMKVLNRGANVLTVYPPVGAQFETFGANVGIPCQMNSALELIPSTTAPSTQWYVA